MSNREDFEASAKEFHQRIIDDLTAAHRIQKWLWDFGGVRRHETLAELQAQDEDNDLELDGLTLAIENLDLYVDGLEMDEMTPHAIEEALDTWRHEYGYGLEVKTVARITLAGGGPAGWLDLTYSKSDRGRWLEIDKAEVFYCDWFQTPVGRVLEDPEMVEEVLGLGEYLEV